MPENFKNAYRQGTRDFKGRPGDNYWQNKSSYKLDVRIDVEKDILFGQGEITYYNNSNDTLSHLIVRLYQDLFEKGASRDWPVSPRDLHDGTAIVSLEINGTDVLEKNGLIPQGTNAIITLPDFLHPDDSVTMNITWKFPIPTHRTIRYGKYEEGVYFIAYWYPEVAVYDDVDGWDTFNFGGIQEFYHDFSDYRISITMPKNYVVWATGELQNADRVLTKKYLERYQKAGNSDEIVHIITSDDLASRGFTRGNKEATWIFEASNVPDVAFAASDHYLWDAVTYKPLENDSPEVLISSAYDKNSTDFYEVADISLQSVAFFSEELPAVGFPYPGITIFNGSGGMEFPMMVNDGSMRSRASTVHVTSHEIAHTYFPFLTGTNERKYAWMDEGWAVMLPFELQENLASGYKPLHSAVQAYEEYAGHDLEVPLMISSINLGGNTYTEAYRNHAYYRSGVAYYLLKDFLGDALFTEALQTFILRWKNKHPIPYDFFFTFNDVVGEDLHWFWKPWFFDMGYPDLAIESVDLKPDATEVVVKMIGHFPIPIHVEVFFDDKSSITIYKSCEIWKDGKGDKMISINNPENKTISKIILGNQNIPDINDTNNTVEIN